jgi:predicted O-linked N-acetylglucosamine transferase (SPINDLY family)
VTIEQALQLALNHQQAGRLNDAEAVYRAVVTSDANHPDAVAGLGIVAQLRGRHAEAITQFRRAIEIEPSAAEFWYNLGNSLLALKRADEAIDAFATAARLNPQFFEPHHNLGTVLIMRGRSNEAVKAQRVACALNPKSPEAHNSYGIALKDQGDVPAAIAAFTKAVDLRPSYHHAHSNRLYAMHFDPSRDAAVIYAAHRTWAEQYNEMPAISSSHDRSSNRRLRIGYVSPSFHDHPVGRSMLPLLERCDRERFEVSCYSDSAGEDHITRRLRAGANEWHDTRSLNDAALADLIRQHRVDILVDLTLHMNRNRLLVFARKPAPLQATFIGYPATTGLRQMDYRITDRFLDPPGQTEAFNSEKLIRLPHSFWCYVPDVDVPIVDRAAGPITFGSLNNPCKLNHEVIDTWCEILRGVPESRLTLFVIERNDIGQRFRRLFEARGIDASRLGFVPLQPRDEYLNQYNCIDVCLDPWPYNGHMTSCDALWMGVPVVSLRGNTSVGRGGESLLANLELTELLASSREEYVKIAVELAQDARRLGEFRRTLRQRMQSSPLCDEKTFARDVYACFTQMWQGFTSRA